MSVIIGNARISEYGTVNGNKGDQTGREVMTQPWSTGGVWQYVIRPKSATHAKKIAKAMKDACANGNIGYSQADRLSLFNLAKANGWKINKVGKCNCDCSSLVSVCCNAAGIAVPSTIYTGNERQALQATGKFTVISDATYTKRESKLKTGDILLRTGHTAIVVDGAVPLETPVKTTGKKKSISAIAKDVIAGKLGNGIVRTNKLKKLGYTEAQIKKIQAKVNKLTAKREKNLDAVAKKVAKGKYGNDPERKKKLKAAGYSEAEIKKIQKKVNQILSK